MTVHRSSFPAFGLSLVALLAVVGGLALGGRGILVVLALAAAAVLVSKPVWAVSLAVALPVLIEDDPLWGPSATPSRLYDLIPGAHVTGLEVVILLAAVAVALDATPPRTVRVRAVRVLGLPLGILGLSLLAGAVVGHAAGTSLTDVISTARTALPLLLLPALVARTVVRHVPTRTAVGCVLALAGVKALLGLVAFAAGEASTIFGGQQLTYYAAPANILGLFGLLGWVAAVLRRLPMPAWAWAAGPLAAASLLLSQRRSFWLAVALGVVLVLLLGLARSSRRVVLPGVLALAAAVALSFGGGIGSGLATPSDTGKTGVQARLKSLDPTAVSQSKDDRYRIGERHNVLDDLRAHPLSGLGLGQAYVQTVPLSIGDIDRTYVHFAALWWWMRDGILGLVGYVSLLLAIGWAGGRVMRRHPDPVVRVAGLAATAGIAGFALAETTATFVGSDPRGSVLLGALIGLLAAALTEAEQPRLSPAAAPR